MEAKRRKIHHPHPNFYLNLKYIDTETYIKILERMPVLCVDLLILNNKGEFLQVKRRYEPMKGRWWTVGGRVRKGESLALAAKRKAREEVGLNVNVILPLGFYEELYSRNPYHIAKGIHTVSIVFICTLVSGEVRLDNQSSAWRYSSKIPQKIKNSMPFNIYFSYKDRKLITDTELYD